MPAASDPIALRSELLFRLFAFYLRWKAGRAFRAVRLSGLDPRIDRDAFPPDRPLVVFCNHPSWWDPATGILLANHCFSGRPGFAPMDQESLGRYGFFRRLGLFGIARDSAAGARRFLQVGRRVLTEAHGARGRAILWITAEGAFTDPRRRPVCLRPGIAHLAASIPDAMLVPLAIEYVFWNESRPELLMRLGTPIDGRLADGRPADWAKTLEQALVDTMDRLATDACERDPARFSLLISGTVGVGGVYDLWRRGRALLGGRRFNVAHEDPHVTMPAERFGQTGTVTGRDA